MFRILKNCIQYIFFEKKCRHFFLNDVTSRYTSPSKLWQCLIQFVARHAYYKPTRIALSSKGNYCTCKQNMTIFSFVFPVTKKRVLNIFSQRSFSALLVAEVKKGLFQQEKIFKKINTKEEKLMNFIIKEIRFV